MLYRDILTVARERALEALAPTRCAGCERPDTLICDSCLRRFTLIDPVHACMRCGAPHGDLLCTECAPGGSDPDRVRERSAPPLARPGCAVDRCLAMAVFAEPLARIIRSYKDAGERRLAPLLAELLLDTALHAEGAAPARFGGIVSRADAVAFVPATSRAFARRGFDHMEAVARPFSELADVELVDALVKYGASDQRALGRAERRGRAAGAYAAIEEVRGRRVLLLDDVITTGSTVAAAAAALRSAGAAHIDALALARVWR